VSEHYLGFARCLVIRVRASSDAMSWFRVRVSLVSAYSHLFILMHHHMQVTCTVDRWPGGSGFADASFAAMFIVARCLIIRVNAWSLRTSITNCMLLTATYNRIVTGLRYMVEVQCY
jgi:hypothetical protein